MSDGSTTMMFRRRLRHWKTTASGLASIVCPIVSLFLPPEWAAKLLAAAGILAGTGLISAADAKPSEVETLRTGIGKL
jgi:hypothetical protein